MRRRGRRYYYSSRRSSSGGKLLFYAVICPLLLMGLMWFISGLGNNPQAWDALTKDLQSAPNTSLQQLSQLLPSSNGGGQSYSDGGGSLQSGPCTSESNLQSVADHYSAKLDIEVVWEVATSEGTDPCIVIAQAINETALGTNPNSADANGIHNLWGIGCGSPRQIPGRCYGRFAVYANWHDAVQGMIEEELRYGFSTWRPTLNKFNSGNPCCGYADSVLQTRDDLAKL